MAYAPNLRTVLQRISQNNVLRPSQKILSSYFLSGCFTCQQRQLYGTIQSEEKNIKDNQTSIIAAFMVKRCASDTTNVASPTRQNKTGVNKMLDTLSNWARIVFRKSILLNSAKNIYECCSNQIDYNLFFKVCNLPDTFQSWFQVVHLHFWMCYIRLNADGKEGKIVHKQMAQCMWEDVKERIKVLGVEDPKMIKKSFNELAEQFYGVTIAYNKGYMDEEGNELARAIWRNLFDENEKTDRKNLNLIMKYLSVQMRLLDEMDSEQLLTKGRIEWLPLDEFMKQNLES